MPNISTDDAIQQLLGVLAEAFEGPQQSWSYFTDSGTASGLFGTLAALAAADASKAWGGTTIVAHVHHAAFAVEASAAWISGDRSSHDWPESWSVSTVNDAGWRGLQRRLRDGYDALRKAISAHASGGVEAFGGSAAAVAHAAYHLGAIRQKVAAGRAAAVTRP
jgi:hypothetical protein